MSYRTTHVKLPISLRERLTTFLLAGWCLGLLTGLAFGLFGPPVPGIG